MATYILKVDERSSFAKKLVEMILAYAENNYDVSLQKKHSDLTKKAIVETKTHQGETFQKANRIMNDLLEFE